jgi:hypothetical protein
MVCRQASGSDKGLHEGKATTTFTKWATTTLSRQATATFTRWATTTLSRQVAVGYEQAASGDGAKSRAAYRAFRKKTIASCLH